MYFTLWEELVCTMIQLSNEAISPSMNNWHSALLPLLRKVNFGNVVVMISALIYGLPIACAQSIQFPLPGLGGALQSSLKKATNNVTHFAGELADSISNPTPAQLAAVSQFSSFVAHLAKVDLADPNAVAYAAKLGARAGQCLVLQLGAPAAGNVARSLEAGMPSRQATTYATVNQQIASAKGALNSRQPCDS